MADVLTMNRVDRLFAILLLLQRKRHVRAQDLARAFEVSERTIYRDIEALYETGVPVLGTPGEGYELMQGYFLPPLLFTAQEANALFLGGRMLMAQTTGQTAHDADHALSKIHVVLPEHMRAELKRLSDVIGFVPSGRKFDFFEPYLAIFQQAIKEQRVTHIRYHSYSQDESTERDIEPFRMYFFNGVWYVESFCRLRMDQRGFRLNRIESVRLLDEKFQQRELPTPPEQGPPRMAHVRVPERTVRWVRERQFYGFCGEQRLQDSSDVIMAYYFGGLQEIMPWLLGWGSAIEILDPTELREAIRSEALAILERHT